MVAKKGKIRTLGGAVVTLVVFCIWLVMNIRVEAGVATPFERGIDGLVAGVLLLILVFLGLSFFRFPPKNDSSEQ